MTTQRTLAAIDCGTNSIRLLISQVDGTTVTREITRRNRIVRLGQGVDATGKLATEALQRVETALSEYVDAMVEHGVADVRMVATSATRDASNRGDFFDLTRRYLGRVVPGAEAEVISGDEEALLSYRGATADNSAPADNAATCVIDLGGGSTEFIVGQEKTILGSISTQMGCVRLTERFLHTDPPTEQEVAAGRAYVEERLAEVKAAIPVGKITKVVGVAGTLTTLSALVQGLQEYDPDKIHQSVLAADDIRAVTHQLRQQSAAERGASPVIMSGREDVIVGGTLVVDGFLDFFESECGIDRIEISERDILDGILASVADR